MISWEQAFTGTESQETAIPPSEIFMAKEKEAPAVPEPSAPEQERKPTREYRKVVRKPSDQPYPPTIQYLHRRLEDIWVKMLLESKGTPKTFLVCGAMQGEGASFVSVHLALFLALGHHMKTLFIDTNVNAIRANPFIPNAHEQPGLASYFTAAQSLPSLVLPTEFDNFFVLSSGAAALEDANQHVIIEKQDIQMLMQYCKDNFDVAIFAGQTITFSPIMLEFAKAVDGVVLVCRYGFSRHEVIRAAIDQLRENDANLTGMILNSREYPVPPWVYRILK